MKRLKQLLFIFLWTWLCSVSAWSFSNGGYTSGTLNQPGDVFLQFSATTVTTSATANVATLTAQNITTNVAYVVPGQSGVVVTYSVTNTDTVARSFDAGLIFLAGQFNAANIDTNYSFTTQNIVALAPGATVTLNFSITIGAGITATAPVYIDAVVLESGLNFRDFFYGNSVANAAAIPPASFDASGSPNIVSLVVTPNPAGPGTVTVTITFSEAMNQSVAPSVNFDTAPSPIYNYSFTGTYNSSTVWIGTANIPFNQSSLYDGTATISVSLAQDLIGTTMGASGNAGTFSIDTTAPTLNLLSHVPTAAPSMPAFPVTIIASEQIATPSNLGLEFILTTGSTQNNLLTFVSSTGGITFNATVAIPANATPSSVATFNFTSNNFQDLAGNTSNAILSGTTVNILLDNIAPLVTASHTGTAALSSSYPITLVASEPLTPTPTLFVEFLTGSGTQNVAVVFNSHTGNITWNGTVLVSSNVVIGSTATLNNFFASDQAFIVNTTNVLAGSLTFTVSAATPYFSELQFDGTPVVNGDIVAAIPVISAVFVNLNGSNPVFVTSSVRVSINGTVVFITPNSVTQVSSNGYALNFIVTTALQLPVGTHLVEVGLNDGIGATATPITRSVTVASTQLGISGTAANIPNPFSPNGDGTNDTTDIIYNLTQSSDISLYVYSIDGVLIYRRDIPSGQIGARAGYNNVTWDGRASFFAGGSQVALPNGVYICHIVGRVDGKQKSLGRIKIVILN